MKLLDILTDCIYSNQVCIYATNAYAEMVIQDNPGIFAAKKKGAHTKNDTE